MLKQILCGATLLFAAGLSNAAIITQNFSVANQATNISELITFDLFDNDGGTRTLESVLFTLHGITNGSAEVENLGPNSTDVNATLSVDISISTVFSGELVSLAPSVTQSTTLDGFDGDIDFAGVSGSKFLDLSADLMDQVELTDGASLAAYTGIGTSSFDFIVNATSNATGGGNLISRFITTAGGDVSIIYTYTEDLSPGVVSEPAYIALFGMGIIAFGRFRRKTA